MFVVDTMMVGRLSKEAVGAVSIGGILFHTVAVFGVGLTLGLDMLVSQSFGAGKMDDCHHSLLNAIYLSLPLVPLLMAGQWAWTWLLEPFGVHPDVRRETIPYLKVILWSTFPCLV